MTKNESELPLVSILIPSYQQKAFLKEAIESALAQSYPNLEIIVSDDGSTDGSVELIQSYEQKYPNIIRGLFEEQNIGTIGNFNKLNAEGRGKYKCRLDGDDLMAPNNISTQVAILEANPQLIGTYHNLELFESDSGKKICNFINRKRPARKGTIQNVIKYGCFFPGAFTLLRREALAGRKNSTKAKVVSDYLFMTDVLAHGGEIGYIDQILGRYRIHENNITGSRIRLIKHTIWAVGIIAIKYPKYTFLCIYRIFDAARAVITKRNTWI